MSELPKQLLAWLARLLPKQKIQGDGAVQVGKVGGNFTVVNVTQYQAPAPSEHFHQRNGSIANPEQREVLRMISRLHNKDSIFLFMTRQFGTHMVIDLQPSQLLRVRRYVESINRRTQKERA